MTVYVLATGQSNLLGAHSGGDREDSLDPNVENWDNGIAGSGINGTSWVRPDFSDSPYVADSNNLVVWFCHRYYKEQSEAVRTVIIGKGGRRVGEWLEDSPSGGDVAMFVDMQSFYGASGAPPADIMLWHQGESDTSLSKSAYKSAWLAMEARVRGDGSLLATDAPILIGGLVDKAEFATMNAALQELADENANVYFAPSTGMTGYPGDTDHFTGPQLVTLGRVRYWNAYAEHISWTPSAPTTKTGTFAGVGPAGL